MLKSCTSLVSIVIVCLLFAVFLGAQQAGVTIDIQTALERARSHSPQFQSASVEVDVARIDRYLAKAAYYPTVSLNSQFLYTQPNGTPEGVFIGSNGIHEYVSQGVVRQDILAPGRMAEYRRSIAAEAVAAAKRDVALRGIVAMRGKAWTKPGALSASPKNWKAAERFPTPTL